MMKIMFMAMLLAAVVPHGCKDNGLVLRESCSVMKEILYPDGEFVLNADERKGLRRQNKEKLANLIQFYQGKCPAA